MLLATSAAVPKSTAPAAARLSTPGRASMVSEAENPAMDRNCIPSAASEAENWVVAPRSSAISLSWSNSAPVAPDTALTLCMDASKSPAVVMAMPPIAAKGAVTEAVIVWPTPRTADPVDCIFVAKPSMSLTASRTPFPTYLAKMLKPREVTAATGHLPRGSAVLRLVVSRCGRTRNSLDVVRQVVALLRVGVGLEEVQAQVPQLLHCFGGQFHLLCPVRARPAAGAQRVGGRPVRKPGHQDVQAADAHVAAEEGVELVFGARVVAGEVGFDVLGVLADEDGEGEQVGGD